MKYFSKKFLYFVRQYIFSTFEKVFILQFQDTTCLHLRYILIHPQHGILKYIHSFKLPCNNLFISYFHFSCQKKLSIKKYVLTYLLASSLQNLLLLIFNVTFKIPDSAHFLEVRRRMLHLKKGLNIILKTKCSLHYGWQNKSLFHFPKK